jgi:ribonuclease HII
MILTEAEKVLKTAPSDIENGLIAQGFSPVAGVDEVGRGPLAGPVVACAVILPEGCVIPGVYDSKKVSEKRRLVLAEKIKAAALAYTFSIIEPEEIDRINILQATLKAMSLAVDGLTDLMFLSKAVLVDGNTPPALSDPSCKILCVTQGDSKSHLIAAASILAKVERDSIMQRLHLEYPIYNWDKNKGYGTAAHRAAIAAHGLCPVHRRSFCKGISHVQ